MIFCINKLVLAKSWLVFSILNKIFSSRLKLQIIGWVKFPIIFYYKKITNNCKTLLWVTPTFYFLIVRTIEILFMGDPSSCYIEFTFISFNQSDKTFFDFSRILINKKGLLSRFFDF